MSTELKLDLQSILQTGLDISPDCFGVLHRDIVIYCNNTFASVFGISKKEAIGKSNKSLLKLAWSNKKGINIDTTDFNDWYANIEQLHNEKKLNQFESDLNDGRWFKITRISLENNYTLLFGVNITDLKKTQKSLQKANQKIEVLANTDQLTAINNRRAFYVIAKQMLKHTKRYYQPISLLLIDIDYFKKVNDNFGHEVGDFILKEFTRRCSKMVRESDSFSRIGGEEFTILLAKTNILDAEKIAEKMRLFIASNSFYITKLDCHVNISVSIGVSTLENNKQNIKDLLIQADKALYYAKANGRNQVSKQDYLFE